MDLQLRSTVDEGGGHPQSGDDAWHGRLRLLGCQEKVSLKFKC